MKLTCQSHRKNALFYAFAVIITFIGSQSMANPFNDGTTNSIVTDTTYDEILYIGIQNPDNTLLIENNATVSADSIVIGQLTSSTNNSVSVAGGSVLIAGNTDTIPLVGGVIVGGTDAGAALSINNNSTLNTEYLYAGLGTDSGRIDLAGEGTELTVAQDVYLGTAGSTNSIEITDGATLSVGGTLTVGSVSSSNNHINVTSGGSLFVNETNSIIVVNADDDNGIVINADSTLQVGGDAETGTFEELGVELKANANLELGGTLTLDQNEIDSRLNIILNNELSTNTASWSSASLTSIGSSTSGNSLTFTNGATGLAANIIQIGQQSTSAGNELNIGGSNSLFIADSDVYVGAQGKNNQLNIGDGGQVDIAENLYFGYDPSASGNQANINSNGVLNVGGDIVVGENGSDSTFTIAGGQVGVTNHFIIGKTANSSGATGGLGTTGNLVSVGEGATLNILKDLAVGQEGSGSILLIRDGSTINVDGDAVIGKASGDNFIFLEPDDPDTRFNVGGDLFVGIEGGLNRFAVYGGTANIQGNLYLGSSTNQYERNYIQIQTTNALLNVANAIYVGESNSLNTLTLAAGAQVNVQDLFVGEYEGTSNNVVTVSGEDNDNQQGWFGYVTNSILTVSNKLEIGSSTGSGNAVILREGGILDVAQTNIVISGTNNILQVTDGGTLKTGDWDYSVLTNTATNIIFESGSTLHLLGELTGTNKVTGGLNIVLDGTNALWDTGTNALFVGNTNDNNSLTITNGALVSTATNLYIGFATVSNSVAVGGTGSVLNVGHDLLIGNVDEEGSGLSELIIADGGYISVGNDASLVHGSRLKIDSASQMEVTGDFEQDQFSTLEVGVSTNQTAPNLVVGGKANLESGATISIYNDGIGEDDTNVVQEIVVSDSLTIDGLTASTTLLLENITIETNLLLDFSVTVTNGNTILVDNFIVHSLGDAAGLEGQLKRVADEIGIMATNGNPQAEAMLRILGAMDAVTAEQTMDNYYGEKMSSSPAHNAINMGMQTVAEQLSMRVDSTRSRMGLASTSSPEGAGGPHMAEQALQGWAAGYKTWVDMSSDNGFDGYDGDIDGFLIGADMSVAEGILVGIAGGAGSANLDKDSSSASTDTDTTYGSIYVSAGTTDWFAEAGLIYGDSSVDLDLGSAFNTEADYDAQNTAIYVGGGKEFIGNYLIITPHASLLANYYDQDSYREKSSNAVGREVESFDELYVQSELGCSVAFYTTLGKLLLKPEFRASWMHEFNADDEDLTYTLIGGTNPYVMTLQAPEEDIIRLGAGITAKLGEYLELRADLDTRQGSEYSDYTVLGSIRYQF